jgi:8-oxo-dGTP pyrophosphatase MutT (NUDIX family)
MLVTAEVVRRALADCDGSVSWKGPIDVRDAKPAAVVVPLTFAPEPSVIVVLRGSQLKDHPGEVGFPGGKPEPGDADLRATALRELGEEIGVADSEVEWLGRLGACPVITGRYLIHPFVAALREGAAPRVVSTEIARVLALPLEPLITGERPFHAVSNLWRGDRSLTPHFELDDCILYGASAHIVHDLLVRVAALLGRELPPPILQEVPPWGDRYRR